MRLFPRILIFSLALLVVRVAGLAQDGGANEGAFDGFAQAPPEASEGGSPGDEEESSENENPEAASEDEAPPENPSGEEARGPDKPVPDFSKGFEMLRGFGLPSAKGGTPRRAQQYYSDPNVWQMLGSHVWEKNPAGGARTLVIGQTFEMTLVKQREDEGMMRMYRGASMDGAMYHASDVLQALQGNFDADNLRKGGADTEFAKKLEAKILKLQGEKIDEWEMSAALAGLARALLFAAQLDELGHKAEANRLANSALTTRFGSKPVVATAVTLLAESAYAQALDRYLKSGDLKAWKSELDKIVAKYSTDYENSLAVRLVAADAACALAPENLGNPEAEALAKIWRSKPLDDASLARLSMESAGGGYSFPGAYLRGGASEDSEESPYPMPWLIDEALAKQEDTVSKLLAKGLDALPILVALTKDKSATPNCIPANTNGMSFSSRRSGSESAAMGHYLGSMPRPTTVAEIATRLLDSAVGGKSEDRRQARPEEMEETVGGWLQELKGRTHKDLVNHYFEHGSPLQMGAAVTVLLKNPEAGDITKIEEFLLEAHPRRNNLMLVQLYLRKRGEAGSEFLKRYRAAVDSESEDGDRQYFSNEWSIYDSDPAKCKKQLRSQLKVLDAMVKPIDLSKLFKTVAEWKKVGEWRTGDDTDTVVVEMNLLSSSMRKLKPEEAVSTWLAEMVKLEDALPRGRMLQMMPQFLEPCPMTEAQRANWKILLEDTREGIPKEELARWGMDGGRSVSEFACRIWEHLHGGTDHERSQELATVLGMDAMDAFCTKRALAAANGETVPPWPDEEKVTDAEMDALLKKFETTPPEQMPAVYEAGSPKEKFALRRSEKAIALFGKARCIVAKIELEDDGVKEALAFTKEWQGKPLTPAMVNQLIETAKLPALRKFGIWVTRKARSPGIDIGVSIMPSSSEQFNKPGIPGSRDERVLAVSLHVSGGGDEGSESEPGSVMAWFLSDAQTKKLDKEHQDSMKSRLEALQKGVEKILNPAEPGPAELYLNISHQIEPDFDPGL